MTDLLDDLRAAWRGVATAQLPPGEARTVALTRVYPAPIEDVWDAVTSPERLARWFTPVSGDLRLGGTYQLDGNAGGQILECEAPNRLLVSWVMGEAPPDSSRVEVRLTTVSEKETELRLEHTAVVDPAFWGQFGPGAVGVGWDLTFLGLGMYIATGKSIDHAEREAWETSPEAVAFIKASVEAWRTAHAESGAGADEADAAAQATLGFYAPSAV